MPPSKSSYALPSDEPSSGVREDHIESAFIARLQGLKYEYRPDITNRATLEKNFREKFEALNRVRLTDAEFARLLSEDYADKVIVTTIQKLGLALDENSKRNKQRKKNDLCFTRAPRFVINGASREIQHYYSMPCAGGWNQTQNK